MAEGAKRAHSDLNINVEGPVEELDIVTERARDYNPDLELAYAKNNGLADVMGHLGNIADNANDLNRTINAYDFEVDYKDRAQEQELEQDRLDKAQSLEIFNTVSAKRVEMVTKIEQAKEQAINSENGDVLAASQGVLEEYRDAFPESFEASAMWSKIFEDEYLQETNYGIKAKYEIEHNKAYHNISQIQNELYRNIVLGKTDISDSMSQLIVRTNAVQGIVPFQQYKEILDNCFNQLVLAKATNLAKVANGGNAAEVANAIRDLVSKYGTRTFDCLSSSGQQLVGKDGQALTYTATLTPKTVEALLAEAQTYDNKASAVGTGGATKTFEEYKEYVGGKDLDSKGVSPYMMSTDSVSAKRDYETLIQTIHLDPTSTPKKKQDQIRKVSEYYYTVVQPAVSTFEAMQLTPDSRLNHAKLQQKLTELSAALDSNQNMVNYSLSFDMTDGKTFELKPNYDYALMGSVDKFQAAHNTWSAIRDTLQRTLQSETTSDFLFGTNYHYTQAANASMSNLKRTSLLTSEGINQRQVDKLTTYLNNVRQAYVDATGSSGTYSALPKSFVKTFYTQYGECSNAQQQSDYTRAVATSLANSGFAGAVLEINPQDIKEKEHQLAAANLQKELFLSVPSLKGIRAYATYSSRQGKGQVTLAHANKYLSEKNLTAKSDSKSSDELPELSEKIINLMTKHNIPASYQEPLMATLANVAMDMAVVNSSPNTLDATEKALLYKGDISSALESIVEANFVAINSPYVNSSVHVGNPALLQGKKVVQATEQAKVIGSMVTEVGDTIHTTLKQMGDKIPKNKIAADLDPITGRITFSTNGDTLGLASEILGIFGSPIGIPYNYMAAKPNTHTTQQWQKEVTDFVSVSTALSVLANDKPSEAFALMGLGSASKLSDPITKKKIDKSVTSADAIRMLTVLQQDNFLKSYADIISSGDKIGVSPAPGYIRDLLKKDKNQGVEEHVGKLLDFAYSKSTAYNKVDITINKPLSYDMQGLNFTGVMSVAHKNGYRISRSYDNVQHGNYISNHAKGMAIDFGVYSNNMEDTLTGLAKVSAMDNFTNMLTKNPAYANKVKRVLTSRPELLENKPEYAAYAKYRAMKNSEGKPLFQDARESDRKYGLNHKNHFHVDFKEQVVDSRGRDFVNAFPALAADMVNTSSKSHTPLNNKMATALLYTFGDRFGQAANQKGQFGMANLTSAEYSMLGLKESLISDPTLQARALANRFQAYSNALGSTDLAVYALAGSKFRNQDNKTMSIQEILNSGKIAGVNGHKYHIAIPMKNGKLDTAEQARQNALFRKYKKSFNR